MKKKLSVTFALILVLLAATQAIAAETVDRIVAIINDEAILMSDLKAAREQFEQDQLLSGNQEALDDAELLQRLIDDKVAAQEGDRLNVEVTKQEIDAAIDDVLRQYGIDEEALRARLAEQGVAFSEYKEKIENQIRRLKLTNRTVRSKVVVDQSKMKAYYSEHREEFREPPKLRLRQFVFQGPNAVTAANDVYRKGRVPTGELDAVAAQYDAQLVDLGELRSDVLNPRFASMVIDLEPGELGRPFESPLGVQMLYLESREPSHIRSFNEVKAEIEEILSREETDKQFTKWLKELRERSIIKIKL